MTAPTTGITGVGRKPKIFHGWWIVMVSFLGDVVGGASAYAFPIFYKPMAESLSLSRTMVALAPTLRTFVNALISPFVGRQIDQRGPRAIMVVGSTLLGGSLIAMAFVHTAWQYFLVYSIMGATALVAYGNLVTQVTVAKWFVRKRGRAVAIVSLAVSVSGVIVTPVAAWLVATHGWRVGWVALGILSWVILVVPSAVFMRRQPEDMGLLPDGDDPATAGAAAPEAAGKKRVPVNRETEQIWTLHMALRSPTFWLIVTAFSLGTMSISAIVLHQFNYMTDKGFSTATAASVVTLYAVNAIIAKIVYGFISERVHIRYLVIVCFAGGAVGIAMLNFANSTTGLFAYAFVYGLTRGAFVLVSPLVYANYFGRTFLGTIRGFASFLNLFGSAGGPLFAAWIYDKTGSYRIAFTLFSATFLLGAFLMYLAKPVRPEQGAALRP